MRQESIFDISFNELSAWQDFLNGKGDGTLNCVHTFIAEFGDRGEGDIKIDIKVCDGGRDGTPFIDTVLFQDGSEVGCLDVRDTIAGEYEFAGFLVDTYIVTIPDTIEAAKEGQRRYRVIEQWLQDMPYIHLMVLENSITKLPNIELDKTVNIDNILEFCKSNDEMFEHLYIMSQSKTNYADMELFETAKDWYILELVERTSPKFSRAFPSEEEVKEVIDAMKKLPEYSQSAFTYFSVTKGAEVKLA